MLTAHDRPPLLARFRAGPPRAVAEVAIVRPEAEIALSVEAGARRRGLATELLHAAARLLALRGVPRLRAVTLPDNRAFIALAARAGARLETGPDEVEAVFDVPTLHHAFLLRRAGLRAA